MGFDFAKNNCRTHQQYGDANPVIRAKGDGAAAGSNEYQYCYTISGQFQKMYTTVYMYILYVCTVHSKTRGQSRPHSAINNRHWYDLSTHMFVVRYNLAFNCKMPTSLGQSHNSMCSIPVCFVNHVDWKSLCPLH